MQNYVNEMAEQIKQGDFAGAAKTHEEWAGKDFMGCVTGLFEVQAKVGRSLYANYDDYCDEYM